MVAKPIRTKMRSFAKKGDATLFFRAMLNEYRPGDWVSDEHAKELEALLEHHPDKAEKIGCGIHHIEVMPDEFGKQCFKIVRSDGSGIDFSYQWCIRCAE